MSSQTSKLPKATFKAVSAEEGVEVHFNPASMVYSVENTISQQASSQTTTQYVSRSSAKLSMELQFDTTDTGTDVRMATRQFAAFMEDSGKNSARASTDGAQQAKDADPKKPAPLPPAAPPVLEFAWGSYLFRGILDSFKETIDFFSEEGIALRAMVSIGLSRQDQVFDQLKPNDTVPKPGSLIPTSATGDLTHITSRAGNPYAARILGATNGLDSLRFTRGASLQVSAGVRLNPPAAFITPPASAGAGFGFSASSGVGFGAAFGGSASAGVPATAGAFAGLQSGVATVSSTSGLDISRMAPATVATSVATFPGASFSIGGAANHTGSAGLTADVGTNFSFSDRLTFSGGS